MEIVLSRTALDPPGLLQTLMTRSGGAGGVVSFTGLVRADAGRTLALELEAYEGFAETVIGETAAAAVGRFGLIDLLVHHRIGRVEVGAPVVFVAAAAAHRRAAFLGADFMMDYLKSRAPFWKKSLDTDGPKWIAPRSEDYADAARWDLEETSPS